MGERFKKHKALFAALYAVLLLALWYGFQNVKKSAADNMTGIGTQTVESMEAVAADEKGNADSEESDGAEEAAVAGAADAKDDGTVNGMSRKAYGGYLDAKVKFTGNDGIEFGIGDTVQKELWTQTTIYANNIPGAFVIDVCLPDDYDESISYPVVYLTDCYWRRENYGEIKELYESGKTKEFILIGIGYPDNYDFDTIRGRDLLNDPDSFLSLIVNGVLPYAESNYNIDTSDRTFCGASYGGYFMVYSLFQSDGITKDVFQNYVLASPTFYARSYGQYLADYEDAYWNRDNTVLKANVYMTVGADEETYFVRPFKNFIKRLEKRNYSGLNVVSKVYEGKEHYTVWVPTLLEGLTLYLSE